MPKILIIDDEKQILSAMQRLLRDSFEVFTAENYNSALDILRSNNIEAVVSDYNLNDQATGVDLLSEIERLFPHITRILITGYSQDYVAKDAINRAGVFKFITKPWDDDNLKCVVNAAVKRTKVVKRNLELLKEIEEQNKKIEMTTQIIERELKLKEKKLMESEETISSVRQQIEAINELLTQISSGKTFKDLVVATLKGISDVVKCEISSIVNITEGDAQFNIYSNGRDEVLSLNNNPSFVSILDTVKNSNYSPLILSSIYAKNENKELLLGTRDVYSMLLYPIYIKTNTGKNNIFILVLGRKGKEPFGKEEVYHLKDISSSIYAAIERLNMVSYIQLGLKQWEDTFNSILDPLFIVSTNYEIIRVNDSVAKIIGESSTSIMGRKCYEVFKNANTVCQGCLVNRVLTSGDVETAEGVSCFGNKNIIGTAYPVVDENGLNGVIQYNNDRSAEFKLYKQLVQSEKLAAIGMLAANIAHEINNPLGGILAYAQLLKKDFPETATIHSDLSEIESACYRGKNIVSNLLDFSRDTSKDTKTVFPVKKIIDGTLPLLNICLKSHKLSVNVAEDQNLLVSGNSGQLQQVLFNLVTNAVHATPSGGEINISASKEDNKILINVSDTGCGIPEDVIPKIFEPFFTTKEKGQGTGLGLFVTYGIINDHGGNIEVKSRVGDGTTFSITLPLWSSADDNHYS